MAAYDHGAGTARKYFEEPSELDGHTIKRRENPYGMSETSLWNAWNAGFDEEHERLLNDDWAEPEDVIEALFDTTKQDDPFAPEHDEHDDEIDDSHSNPQKDDEHNDETNDEEDDQILDKDDEY